MNVSDYHLTAVEEAELAKDLWESFEGNFKAKSNARHLLLRQQLSRLELVRNKPIPQYLARAKGLKLDLQ